MLKHTLTVHLLIYLEIPQADLATKMVLLQDLFRLTNDYPQVEKRKKMCPLCWRLLWAAIFLRAG